MANLKQWENTAMDMQMVQGNQGNATGSGRFDGRRRDSMSDDDFPMVAFSLLMTGQGMIWCAIGFCFAWLMYA